MGVNEKAAFFDGIADKWDGWDDLDALAEKLAAGLAGFGVRPDEHILDVGCGTGNLTLALLKILSQPGRVTAVDISPAMIRTARGKIADSRAQFHVAGAGRLPFEDAVFDRVICFSVWPHLDDHAATVRELRRVLKTGGRLHVWHLIPRSKVNEIHASAGEAVRHDLLAPADDTAALLMDAGLSVAEIVDNQQRYLVTAVK
jgi:demethylmenaquinone methyltransferase/2-methoxy-6-polyprenyl-1,4-benzoquinol methylase